MRMRFFLSLVGCFLCVGVYAEVPIRPDTISNWQIYYGKEKVIHGNSVQLAEVLVPEVRLGREALVIYYNHDTGNPKGQHIEIREHERSLYLISFDVGPARIDLYKALEKVHAGKHVLSFYYWVGDGHDKQWLGDFTILE